MDASNIEDGEFDNSSDNTSSAFSTNEDDLSDAREERSSDLEVIHVSPGAKRSTALVDKPHMVRRNVRLFYQQVASRSK